MFDRLPKLACLIILTQCYQQQLRQLRRTNAKLGPEIGTPNWDLYVRRKWGSYRSGLEHVGGCWRGARANW